MNVDTYIRQLDPALHGGSDDPDSHEAQLILQRVQHPPAPHRVRRHTVQAGFALGALGAVAAIGLVIAGMTGPTPARSPAAHATRPAVHDTGPVMQVASYRLQLPSSYHLTAATTSTCPALSVTFSQPSTTPEGGQSTASRADVPQYAAQVASQANTAGGCIAMVLAPPYTPTAATPDPEAGSAVGAQAVQVGPFKGLAGTSTVYTTPSDAHSTAEWLYVEIPLTGGQYQDLAVSGYGLSQSELVTLVASGLSVTGASSSPETTTTSPTSTTSGAAGSAETSGSTGATTEAGSSEIA